MKASRQGGKTRNKVRQYVKISTTYSGGNLQAGIQAALIITKEMKHSEKSFGYEVQLHGIHFDL